MGVARKDGDSLISTGLVISFVIIHLAIWWVQAALGEWVGDVSACTDALCGTPLEGLAETFNAKGVGIADIGKFVTGSVSLVVGIFSFNYAILPHDGPIGSVVTIIRVIGGVIVAITLGNLGANILGRIFGR